MPASILVLAAARGNTAAPDPRLVSAVRAIAAAGYDVEGFDLATALHRRALEPDVLDPSTARLADRHRAMERKTHLSGDEEARYAEIALLAVLAPEARAVAREAWGALETAAPYRPFDAGKPPDAPWLRRLVHLAREVVESSAAPERVLRLVLPDLAARRARIVALVEDEADGRADRSLLERLEEAGLGPLVLLPPEEGEMVARVRAAVGTAGGDAPRASPRVIGPWPAPMALTNADGAASVAFVRDEDAQLQALAVAGEDPVPRDDAALGPALLARGGGDRLAHADRHLFVALGAGAHIRRPAMPPRPAAIVRRARGLRIVRLRHEIAPPRASAGVGRTAADQIRAGVGRRRERVHLVDLSGGSVREASEPESRVLDALTEPMALGALAGEIGAEGDEAAGALGSIVSSLAREGLLSVSHGEGAGGRR